MSTKQTWKPRPLLHPDGREYTPSSEREETMLLTAYGYRVKDEQPKSRKSAATDTNSTGGS